MEDNDKEDKKWYVFSNNGKKSTSKASQCKKPMHGVEKIQHMQAKEKRK